MRLAIPAISAALLAMPLGTASAQTPTVTSQVTAPSAVQCSATFNSSIALTGFDVQDPGVADIVLVLDESGSIDSTEFAQERQFAHSLIDQLMTGPGGARMGLVMFSNDARKIGNNLFDNKTYMLNALNSVDQRGGFTCIGCGMAFGQQVLEAPPLRPQATRFMIVLTDGANNRFYQNHPLLADITSVKNAGTKVLAVGVGNGIDQNEIHEIASAIPGVQTEFLVNDFNALSQVIPALTAAISSPGATDITVEVEVLPRFPLTGAAATAGTVTPAGSHVTWTLPSLGSQTQTLTMGHQQDGQGAGSLMVFSATYLDSEGHAVTIDEPFTTVNGCNMAPVANAGSDATVQLVGGPTAMAQLDGSGSTDDGLLQPLTFSWSSDTGFNASGPSPSLSLPHGTHTFTLTVNDGELSDTDTVVVDVVDPTAPVITPTVSGTLGDHGWYTSDVQVSWSTSDAETGVASSTGCSAASVVADTASQSFTCEATNGAGAMSSDTATVKRDATPPDLVVSGPITAEATSNAGATVSYAAPSASDATSDLAGPPSCAPASGGLFPQGTTEVTCTATDLAGNTSTASFAVTVADTQPPMIDGVTPSQDTLWPPSHGMLDIAIAASATDDVSAATCAISNVSSSEPDNGLGDGDTAGDIVIVPPLSVQLRAERSGQGPGRVYTIEVTCTDAAGNASVATTMVSVPKNRGR